MIDIKNNQAFRSRGEMVQWYQSQIQYYKDNIGKTTQFGIVITKALPLTLEKRLKSLRYREQ